MRSLAQTNEYDPMFEDDDFESIMTAIQNDEHKTLPSNTDDAGGRTGPQETGANSDDDAGGRTGTQETGANSDDDAMRVVLEKVLPGRIQGRQVYRIRTQPC